VDFIYWKSELGRELRKILLCGPEKKIWPVVTVNLENVQSVTPWLRYFHTGIYGHTKYTRSIDFDDTRNAGFENLSKGIEFCLREKSQWLKFRIPEI